MKLSRLTLAIGLFCLALLVLIWVATLQRIRFERDEMTADITARNSNLAMAIEEHALRTFKGIDQVLLFVRHLYRLQGAQLNIRQLIADGEIDSSFVTFIGVFDAHGDLLFGSEPFKRTNIADREYFKFHQQRGGDEVLVGKPVAGRANGRWALPISRRINNPDGSFGGVVDVGVDPNYFSRFYEQTDIGKQDLIVLVGLDGISRARHAGEQNTSGEDMRASTLFAEQAKHSSGSFRSMDAMDSVPRFISYRTMRQFPLIVAVGTAEAEALSEFHDNERYYYFGAALASVFIGFCGAGLLVGLARERRAATTIARDEARFRATFDQAAVGIMHVGLDGRLLRVNQALRAMLGFTEQELLVRSFRDITYPPDLAISEKYARLLLADKAKPYFDQLEKRYLRKDGGMIWVLVAASVVRDASGNPSYFVTLVQDISERKRAQEALERSNTDLQQFAYVASHDLKTPLRSVCGFVELLQVHYAAQLDDRAADWIRRAAAGAKRLHTLTDELLAYARMDSRAERFTPTNCESVFRSAVQLLETTIDESGAEVSAGDLPVVVADQTQLVQLFQNLIDNGIKFHGAQTPSVHVSAARKDGEWVFAVADNGIGIDAKHRERVFEIFRRLHTEQEFSGTGIGLAVCRRIVHRHGGRIWIESEPGKGCTFFFTIPDSGTPSSG